MTTYKNTDAIKTKRDPIVLKEVACVVFYRPTKNSTYDRGWYVREYHSAYAMERHLSGEPGWEMSYSDIGPFTKKEAKEYALEPLNWNDDDET